MDHSTCVLIEGEVYNKSELISEMASRGYKFTYNNLAELVLLLYEELGESFPVKLNGAFIIAIWNATTRQLLLINDRLGLYPLYFSHASGNLMFGSGVRALLANPAISRNIDRIGIAEFLAFDHLLDERTLLESVHLLPQASILSFHDGSIRVRSYWDVCIPDEYPLRNEMDYMEEFLSLMAQAVSRQSAYDHSESGILLSGGLDSRIILAELVKVNDPRTLHTLTWGIPGCDDDRYSKEVSTKLRVNHHFFELKPDWLLNNADRAVRITDGMGNLVNLHSLATLDEETQIVKILYKGFLGDAMMGFALRPQFWAHYDEQTRWQAHLQVHSDQGVITFNLQEQQQLFTDSFKKGIKNGVIDSYKDGMLASMRNDLANQRIYFDYTQRVPRMTLMGVEIVRSRASVRLPFTDNDLVDFAIKLPPGHLYERKLMRNAFVLGFPKLAQIPLADTGLPMMECTRDVLRRADYVLRWHLNSAGLKWISKQTRRPYKDYNLWFRTILRDWVEGILLSPLSLDRGYYNPEYIRRLLADHMAGANYAVRIGALLSIELWHRQFLD